MSFQSQHVKLMHFYLHTHVTVFSERRVLCILPHGKESKGNRHDYTDVDINRWHDRYDFNEAESMVPPASHRGMAI